MMVAFLLEPHNDTLAIRRLEALSCEKVNCSIHVQNKHYLREVGSIYQSIWMTLSALVRRKRCWSAHLYRLDCIIVDMEKMLQSHAQMVCSLLL